MSNLNLQNLENYRDEILKAEIGALLFNLGKTHIGFWRRKGDKQYFNVDEQYFKSKFGYDVFDSYMNYYSDKNNQLSPFKIDLSKFGDLIKDFILGQDKKVKFPFEVVIKNEKNKQEANEIIWEEFFKGDNSEVEFIQKVFFRGCENINSGIDKGNPVEQLKPPLWLSNAFGSFKHKIKEEDFDDARIKFFRDLDCFLKRNDYYTNPNWQEIREFIFDKVKPWYSKLLSDSRYPVNDVSLWDQAYMTASMFKAVLSNLVLGSSKLETYQNNPSSIKWRILGIQYDKLGLAEKGFKPAHIDWYRNISKEIDNKIKELLEYEYPIGNEVYRDETGIYFIVGEDLGDGEGDLAILRSNLNEIKEKILEIFKEKSLDEFYPAIFLTKASRGLMNLTYLLEKARENFLKSDWSKKDLALNLGDGYPVGICQICKQRLVFENDERDENKNVCKTCYDNKTKGRVDAWLNNRTGETIWTSELKDKNDRLALVVMKFELMDWLNGDLLNTSSLQIGINLGNDVKELVNTLDEIFKKGQDKKVGDTILKKYIDKALHGLKIEHNKIIESFLLERSIGDRWEEFIYKALGDWNEHNKKPIKNKIDFDNRKIEWSNLTNKDIEFLSILILQFLLRKNPSPARLRRIWESTQEFFEEIEEKLLCVANIPDERKIRLYWNLRSQVRYEGEDWAGNLEFWIRDGKAFLITYDEEIIRHYKNFRCVPEKDKKLYLEKSKITLSLQDAHFEIYKPYMSIINPTPISWQFIIPAEYVPELIKNTQNLYDEYFKYVYGKLPLHVGVIIQDYKKPLYVGINALRKIRRDVKDRKKIWEEIEAKFFKEIFNDKIKKGKIEEQRNSPIEHYSLYFGDLTSGDYQFYVSPDNSPCLMKNVDRLNNDEEINYIPNSFDFEFLDTNIRRNDIYYDESKNYTRKADLKTNKPYNIEKHFDKFEKFKKAFNEGTSVSKLHNIINIFYEKAILKEDLDDGTKKFLASAIINTLEPTKSEKIKELVKIWLGIENITYQEVEGYLSNDKIKMFLDMYEFWHKALKEV
jgi:CRISPR-associated Csx11 family protein